MASIFNLNAQSGKIQGTVNDSKSGITLNQVHVYIKGTRIGSTTSGQGQFQLDGVPAGIHTVVVSNVGYKTFIQTVKVVSGEIANLNLSLEESVINLPGVVVERVTLTGGKGGIQDIPGSAYYISPKELQQFNYNDINRTLRSVPGINVQEEDGFGLRPNIGMRGTGVERSSKITIMEDGILAAPAPYAAPAAYHFPTAGRMHAVEVLKGASQIKYGPYTTGGAINLISNLIPSEFSGRINLFAGSFDTHTIHANVGNSYKNVGFLVETYQSNSDGFKDLDGGGNTGFDKKDYLAKIRINTNAKAPIYQSLTFKIGQTNETSDETYLGLTDQDFNRNPYRRYAASQLDQITTQQNQFSLTHVIRPLAFMDVTTTAYRSEFERNWYKLDRIRATSDGDRTKINDLLERPAEYPEAYAIMIGNSSPNPNALELKNNNREYYAQGIQTLLGFQFGSNSVHHDLELGVRLHEDQVDRFQWVDLYAMDEGVLELTNRGIPGTESNRVTTSNALAAHIQYKISYNKLTAIPGLRYESISLERLDYGINDVSRTGVELETRENNVNVLIPGFGLDYQINKSLSTFIGIHKGFSPPGSNDGSEPEKSVNYELGSRFNLIGLNGEVVFFLNDYDNLLGTDLAAAGGAGSNDLFNGGQSRAKGIELQLNYDLLYLNPKVSLPISFIYTYTDATFQNNFESEFEGWGTVVSGDELPYLAKNQFSVLTSLETRKFRVSLNGRYMDEMRTVAGQGDISNPFKTDSYFVLDMSTEYSFGEEVSLFGSVKNLTDEVYVVARRPAGLRPGMPRAFNIGVKVRF